MHKNLFKKTESNGLTRENVPKMYNIILYIEKKINTKLCKFK